MDQLGVFPGHRSAGYVGRVLAETFRAYVSAILVIVVGILLGAECGSFSAVLTVHHYEADTGFGDWDLGNTPRAVSFGSLVMAMMFFNTAMMPTEMYAKALSPFVDFSPITAVAQLASDARIGLWEPNYVRLFTIWFRGLAVCGMLGIKLKVSRR